MKLLVVFVLALVAATAFALLAARLVDAGNARLRAVRDTAWGVATTLLLVLAVYAAHAIGLFSVPLVAVAIAGIGIPLRAYLVATRRRRAEQAAAIAARAAPPPAGIEGLLARHQILVLLVAGCATAVAAGAAATVIGPH